MECLLSKFYEKLLCQKSLSLQGLVIVYAFSIKSIQPNMCEIGYKAGPNYTCIDRFVVFTNLLIYRNRNECESSVCTEHSECFNTDGSFYCQCKSGFLNTNGDMSICRDIDECRQSDICLEHATCLNIPDMSDHFSSLRIWTSM